MFLTYKISEIIAQFSELSVQPKEIKSRSANFQHVECFHKSLINTQKGKFNTYADTYHK